MTTTGQPAGRRRKRLSPWPYLFSAPFVICYLVFNLYPTLYSLYLSLFDWNGIADRAYIGLDNYKEILTADPLFFKALWNTLWMMVVSIPGQIIMGLLLAQFVFSLRRLQRLYETMIFLPYIIAPVVVGVIFSYLFDWQLGYVNDILSRIGLIRENVYWLQTPSLVKYVIGAMNIWRQAGYCMVIYLAAMTAIPLEINEAAYIDGANSLQAFWYITIPQLKNITLFLVLTSIINGLQMFDMPAMLYAGGGMAAGYTGGPENAALTVIWKFYDDTFKTGLRLGYGAAISYSLFVIIVLFTVGSYLLSARKEGDR